MSDFDDDLLALVDDVPSKKPTVRKRKRGSDSSDMEVSSGSDSDGDYSHAKQAAPVSDEEDFTNPYPLEGKYKDPADKAAIMSMKELDRESILQERAEEVQKHLDRLTVSKMAKAAAGATGNRESSRKVTATGKTQTKTLKLDELKRKRESKKNRGKAGDDDDDDYGPTKRRSSRRDDSDATMESDADDSDDGTRKSRRKKSAGNRKSAVKDELATQTEIRPLCMPRSEILKHWPKSFFPDVAAGCFVRVSIGLDENRQMMYRLCQVQGVEPNGKPYKVDKEPCDMYLKISHAAAKRTIDFNQVSNGATSNGADGVRVEPFTPKEYLRWLASMEAENVPIPRKSEMLAKYEKVRAMRKNAATELELQEVYRKKLELDPSRENPALRRARLKDLITVARQQNKPDEVARLTAELRSLDAPPASPAAQKSADSPAANSGSAPGTPANNAWAAVHELHRRQQREEQRKAELQAKRAAESSGKLDPSARVKTNVRIMHDVRASTPDVADNVQFSAPEPMLPATQPEAQRAAAKPKFGPSKIEQTAKSIVLDLGDF